MSIYSIALTFSVIRRGLTGLTEEVLAFFDTGMGGGTYDSSFTCQHSCLRKNDVYRDRNYHQERLLNVNQEDIIGPWTICSTRAQNGSAVIYYSASRELCSQPVK